MIPIHSIKVSETPDFNELSGLVGEFRLWYQFPPGNCLVPRADAFVAASLIYAMHLGEDLEIETDVPISPLLLENLDRLQDIFSLWSSYLNLPLRKIKISGGRIERAVSKNSDTVAFFSGGVDGNYTLKKNREYIDYLIFAKGIDMQLSNHELYEEALNRNSEYLKTKGKSIRPVATNVRFLGHQASISWHICFGGGLSSIALAGGYKACYIASGISYAEPYPHGSTAITDPLWTNEQTTIIHDGAEKSRLQKIRHIMEDPLLKDVLRVCWQDAAYNCGKCEKCLRTMCALRALNIETSTFPDCTDELLRDHVSKLPLHDDIDLAFVRENLSEARKNGDKKLAKVLGKLERRYNLKQALKLLDSALLGGKIRALKEISN